jgi:DNA polymerase-3 subunit epsilon
VISTINTYEICGTELMALLLECSEIKQLWPIHNKSLSALNQNSDYLNTARNGYKLYLAVGKLAKNQKRHLIIFTVV